MVKQLYKEKELKKIKKECVLTMLELYKIAHAGHIGSSLSCLDILIYLHFIQMNEEDKFVLSKGHAAAALYTVLHKSGKISKETLQTFYQEGTLLAAHPPCGEGALEGINFGTGSLGHGLSLATGFALSNRFKDKNFNVYCVLSDGDCNEGSTWEAAMFAAHYNLSNLVAIIDNNGLQGFGKTEDVIDMEPMKEKWRSFNFEVYESVEGNEFNSLEEVFSKINKSKSSKPKCVIAKTTKGSGVSYMEHKLEWHYLPMDDELYEAAIREIRKT